MAKEDAYKSSTVSVASGEAASSLSRPPAQRKAGVARPIANGKLLRAGGPGSAPAAVSRYVLHIAKILM